MKSNSQTVKTQKQESKAGKPQQPEKPDDDLEPCTTPTAVEALRFNTPDEACDDGVN